MKEIFTMDLKGKLLIAVVFMVLGFMLSVQYKTTELQRNVRMDRVEDLSERLKVMEAENKQLLTELETLRAGAAKDPADDRMKLMAGTTDVEGEGIEILLDDSNIAKSPAKILICTSFMMKICCVCSTSCALPVRKQFLSTISALWL